MPLENFVGSKNPQQIMTESNCASYENDVVFFLASPAKSVGGILNPIVIVQFCSTTAANSTDKGLWLRPKFLFLMPWSLLLPRQGMRAKPDAVGPFGRTVPWPSASWTYQRSRTLRPVGQGEMLNL
jgi:hypothetical protein